MGVEEGGLKVKETFFINHGAPTWPIDDDDPGSDFLKTFQTSLFPTRPSSILFLTGHWETTFPTVNVVSSGVNDTIYDYGGIPFPEATFHLKYPAPGAPELAKRVKQLLLESGFERVDEDHGRGLDHAAWVPLMFMYPEADIPVCQLSLQIEKDATYHYNLGKALAPLKDENVLIIGSGSAVHNLGRVTIGERHSPIFPWATEFDEWLKEALLDGRYEDVNNYEEKAPNAKLAHPTPDHFYPLNFALGAAGENCKAELLHTSFAYGNLSYAAYRFTTQD